MPNRWSPEEKSAYTKIWNEGNQEGWKVADIDAKFNAEIQQQGYPPRTSQSCSHFRRCNNMKYREWTAEDSKRLMQEAEAATTCGRVSWIKVKNKFDEVGSIKRPPEEYRKQYNRLYKRQLEEGDSKDDSMTTTKRPRQEWTQQEIHTLRELTKVPLPEVYQRFVENMRKLDPTYPTHLRSSDAVLSRLRRGKFDDVQPARVKWRKDWMEQLNDILKNSPTFTAGFELAASIWNFSVSSLRRYWNRNRARLRLQQAENVASDSSARKDMPSTNRPVVLQIDQDPVPPAIDSGVATTSPSGSAPSVPGAIESDLDPTPPMISKTSPSGSLPSVPNAIASDFGANEGDEFGFTAEVDEEDEDFVGNTFDFGSPLQSASDCGADEGDEAEVDGENEDFVRNTFDFGSALQSALQFAANLPALGPEALTRPASLRPAIPAPSSTTDLVQSTKSSPKKEQDAKDVPSNASEDPEEVSEDPEEVSEDLEEVSKVARRFIPLAEVRSLLFIMTCLGSKDKQDFMMFLTSECCAGSKCALSYGFREAADICRHRKFLEGGQIHQPDFTSYDDYKTYNILANHLELSVMCSDRAKVIYEKEKQYRNLGQENKRLRSGWYMNFEIEKKGNLGDFFDDWQDCPENMKTWMNYFAVFEVKRCDGRKLDPSKQMYQVGRVRRRESESWYTGVLFDRDGWKLLVYCEFKQAQAWSKAVLWMPFDSALQHVRRFQAADRLPKTELVGYIIRRRAATTPRPSSHELRDAREDLNPEQFEAVNNVISFQGMTLVRGPFGCGKSRTIAWMIRALLECKCDEKILVVAETSTAVENILERLHEMNLPKKTIVRLGPMSPDCKTELLHYSHERQLEHIHDDEERQRMSKSVLKNGQIFLSTMSSAGNHSALRVQFGIIINDEAAQTPEQSLLIGLRSATKSLVLFGDPKQLPPFSYLRDRKRDRKRDQERDKTPEYDLRSLMVIIQDEYEKRGLNYPGVTLCTQYRCHPKISWILAGFYPDFNLEDGPDISPDSYLENMPLDNSISLDEKRAKARVILYNCKAKLDLPRGKRDSCNVIEAWLTIEILVTIASHLRESHQDKRTVAMITPYLDQKALLCDLVREHEMNWNDMLEVRVYSVDGVQGQEADIGIVTLCRNNKKNTIGFLADNPHRALVGLSRTKDYLFFVCQKEMFMQSPYWRDVFGRIENSDAVELGDWRSEADIDKLRRRGDFRYF